MIGGYLASLGIGFSLAWGVMGIINRAHGALIMLGAYVTFWLFARFRVDPFLSIPITMLVLFVFGYLLQRYVINLIMKTAQTMSLVLTWGIDMLIVNAVLLAFTANFRSVNPTYAGKYLSIGTLTIPYVRLGVLVVAIALTFALWAFMWKTKTGKAILATAFDKEAASLLGVDIRQIYAVTLGISAAMAGAAGALTSTVYAFTPTLGALLISQAFVVTVLGGLGDMRGIILCGLFLGLAESIGVTLIGPEQQTAIDVVILIAVLLVRPQGILGKKYFETKRMA